jgi:hypothetical protein
MDNITPDTFRIMTVELVTEGPKYKAIAIRKFAEE